MIPFIWTAIAFLWKVIVSFWEMIGFVRILIVPQSIVITFLWGTIVSVWEMIAFVGMLNQPQKKYLFLVKERIRQCAFYYEPGQFSLLMLKNYFK